VKLDALWRRATELERPGIPRRRLVCLATLQPCAIQNAD